MFDFSIQPGNGPIVKQLMQQIIHSREEKYLAAGAKLPSTRELAAQLHISRNAAVEAYEELLNAGVVYVIPGKGTFVAQGEQQDTVAKRFEWGTLVNKYGTDCRLMDVIKQEASWYTPKQHLDGVKSCSLISFKSIAPDSSLFDTEEVKRAFYTCISKLGGILLNYGYANGYLPFREYLKTYMMQKGVSTLHKDILITNGFTEGFEMLLSAYTEPGDVILCENPTHNTALKQMRALGLVPYGVPITKDGLDPIALEAALRTQHAKFLYMIPSYHNPTGIVTSGEKRRIIYDLCCRYGVPIIEDGFCEELLYHASHCAPVAAFDESCGQVIYVGSLSKVLFPGLRIGWILADPAVIDVLESVKRCRNIHTSVLDQAILYEYMASGAFDKYIRRIRKIYKGKYECAIQAAERYLKPDIIWGEGGTHIFLGWDSSLNTRFLLADAYERGVLYMPGDMFTTDGTGANTLRLGISRLQLPQIEEGMKRLSGVFGQKT